MIVLKSVITGIVGVLLLFAIKIVAKVIGVYPMTLAFKVKGRQALYTTMMMSTGLTFGSISALFGLTHGYIDQAQYSILVTVVILIAPIHRSISHRPFYPTSHPLTQHP